MKKILYILLLVSLLATIPVAALASEGKPPMDRLVNSDWNCIQLPGDTDYHCFDPGDGKSSNHSSLNVLVFNGDKELLGTEVLWSVGTYGGQSCPQDVLLTPADIEIPYYACHHYSH